MKYIKSIVFLLFVSQSGLSQIDMMKDGLEACQSEAEFAFVNDLFTELETFAFNALGIENNDYQSLALTFCQISETDRFIIGDDTKLSQLIKKGIKDGFWIYEKYDPNEVTVVNGDTLEVTPPEGEEFSPESVEQCYINSASSYIECSKDYVFHKGMMIYYKSYASFSVGASNVKLCSMKEFFAPGDYALTSIKQFILIHCICQRIIHENKYYQYFEQ